MLKYSEHRCKRLAYLRTVVVPVLLKLQQIRTGDGKKPGKGNKQDSERLKCIGNWATRSISEFHSPDQAKNVSKSILPETKIIPTHISIAKNGWDLAGLISVNIANRLLTFTTQYSVKESFAEFCLDVSSPPSAVSPLVDSRSKQIA